MSDEKLAAARMSDAMGKLQDALSRLKLAAEELAIVDASLIGSDAHRRLIVHKPDGEMIAIRNHLMGNEGSGGLGGSDGSVPHRSLVAG